MSDLNSFTKSHDGDLVRVKHGFENVFYPDIPMGGWVGTVLFADSNMCLIRWSTETLENIHPIYRKRCERDGLDIEEYWVDPNYLEPAPIEPLNMEQPTNIVTRPLSADNQEDRICMVFGLTSDDPLPCDNKDTQRIYFDYLKANLTFPFPVCFFDPIKNQTRNMTVTGMCDDFPIDEGFGVMCEVLDGTENRQIPLWELEVESDNPNYQMVDDYIFWYTNSLEEGENDDEDDEEWDFDEDEYWDDQELDDEDEYWDDDYDVEEIVPPPPPRQKVRRNGPCPCGSGKKFKKCCLRKQDGDAFFD